MVSPSSESKPAWEFPLLNQSMHYPGDASHSLSTPSPKSAASSGYTNLSFDFQNAVSISSDPDLSNCNGAPPEILSRTQDTMVHVGGTVMLSCLVLNGVGSQIVWRKSEPGPSMVISSSSAKFKTTYTSNGEARLFIFRTEIHDSGIYVCTISNQFGIVQCAIGLTVLPSVGLGDDYEAECNPEIYLEVINPNSVRVSWDYTASTTNSYIIEYCRTGANQWRSNDDKPVRSRYILTGLTPGDSYVFRLVSATTSAVSSPSSPISMPLTEQHMWQQQQFNNRYTSLAELGRGRFSVIRLATDAVTSQKVALKQVLRKQQDLACTQEEYKLLSSAQHPNIVRGLALFENAPQQGIDTIVMEL